MYNFLNPALFHLLTNVKLIYGSFICSPLHKCTDFFRGSCGNHACSPPACKSQTPNSSSAFSEPSLEHKRIPALSPGIQTLFGGMEDKSQFYLYFFFLFFLNPKQCQDGWRAAPRSPASAERFCPRRKCGVPGQHCSPFVCSEPGSSRIKGSVRELLLQRGPGKQDSVPWLSYQHPANASAAKGSSARGAGRALLLEGSATIPVQHPE